MRTLPAQIQHRATQLTFIVVLVAVFLPRAFGLDQYVTTDEAKWIVRAANFYYALGQRNFERTYWTEHPGVTVMWAGTAAFLWQFPEFRGVGLVDKADVFNYEEILAQRADLTPVKMLAASRLVMVLGNTLILGLSFLYVRKLIGLLPALLGFLWIAFDPFFIAHTRLLHLDGLLSALILLAVVAYALYLRERKLIHLIVSGAAAGLAWLTKSPSIFLLPAAGLLAGLDLLRVALHQRPANRAEWLPQIWRQVGPILLWMLVGAVLFFMLFPAMWVAPVKYLSRMLMSMFAYASFGHESSVFFNGQLFNSGHVGLASFYPVMFLWRITPLTLLGLLFALIVIAKNYKTILQFQETYFELILLILSLAFVIFMNLGGKKFDRYILPIFPMVAILVGVGWYWAARQVAGWLPTPKAARASLQWGLVAAVLAGQLFFALATFPYFVTYYNPLLGGIQTASQEIMIGWGEGLEQAAAYLNSKPNAEKLEVISWYRTGCFSYFFEGNSRYIYITPTVGEEKLQEYRETIDYAVIYQHQWNRQLPKDLLDYLAQQEPEHAIWIDGVEYVRIYQLKGPDL